MLAPVNLRSLIFFFSRPCPLGLPGPYLLLLLYPRVLFPFYYSSSIYCQVILVVWVQWMCYFGAAGPYNPHQRVESVLERDDWEKRLPKHAG